MLKIVGSTVHIYDFGLSLSAEILEENVPRYENCGGANPILKQLLTRVKTNIFSSENAQSMFSNV